MVGFSDSQIFRFLDARLALMNSYEPMNLSNLCPYELMPSPTFSLSCTFNIKIKTMSQLPPIVLECPECGERYLVSRDTEMLSEKAVRYSDGYFIDEKNWRTPLVIGCVTCELGFFPEKGKLVAKPTWEEFDEEWAKIKKAEAPTAGSLALELRARKNMSNVEEIALRSEFWYAGNHTETGRILMGKNKKFQNFWTESLEKLEKLLNSSEEKNLLLKAEINRQLGNFERCIKLLEEIPGDQAQQIVEAAKKQETKVFKLN